jgi:ADP-ribose pyrophosphatase YjhB (NUDIX family)
MARKKQYGALPYRIRKCELQVLLITTRKKGHWSLPKGWPIKNATPAETAAIEAFEEAGAHGVVHPVRLGTIVKRRAKRERIVRIFPMQVTRLNKTWPERYERERRWVSLHEAAKLVQQDDVRNVVVRLAHVHAGS